MTEKAFTDLQIQVLRYVGKTVMKTGESPDIKQMAGDLGFVDWRNARKAVKRLMERGFFTPFDPNTGLFALTGKPYPGAARVGGVGRPQKKNKPNLWKKPVSGRGEPKKRRCLGPCREEFKSAWSGERICPSCKQRDTWQSGDYGMEVSVHV